MSRRLPWRRGATAADGPPPGPANGPATATATAVVPAPTTRSRLRDVTPLLYLQSAHPRQAVLTALGLTLVAALDGRPGRELLLVLATVLVGQAILGWHNDVVDRRRDLRHRTTGKPVADGRLEPGSVWFAIVVALLALVPLAVSTGFVAGATYLLAVLVGLLGNYWPRRNVLSFLPWAVSYGLYPAYLTYGGFGGAALGDPPGIVVTVLAALVGVGVHVIRSVWGLVPDHEDGWRSLPLRLGERLGASRLLLAGSVATAVLLVALALTVNAVGLSQ